MAEDYDKKIKDEQAKLKKYSFASYDSKKRGYVIDGNVYTKSKLDNLIEQSNKAIKDYESAKKSKKESKFRDFDIQTSLGAEYSRLVKIATDIKVKDYDSSIESLRAWRNVQTFVENNNQIKSVEIVTKNPSVLEISTAWIRSGVGPKYIPTTKDVDPKKVQENIDNAAAVATTFAEKDTTDSSQQYQVVKAGKTLVKNRKVVTDEPTLTARQTEIDSIKSGQEPPTEVLSSARKGAVVTPKVVLQTPTVSTPTTTTGQTPAATSASTPSGMSFRQVEGFAPGKKTTTKGKGNKPGTGGTGGGADTVVVDGTKVKVGSNQWQSIIQQEFGSLWDVYNGNADVKAVIDKAVKEGYYNDTDKMTAALQNTGWYRTTEFSARKFKLRQSTDPATVDDEINTQVEEIRAQTIARGTTLSDATLRKLATDKLKFGYSDQQLLNAIGSEEVAQAQLGGAQGLANLRQGSTARNLRDKAASYYQKVSDTLIDTWTQEILTGKRSETQFEDLMRDSARTQFRSLQPALDNGQDVKTAMYAYEAQAQNVLGSTIDTSQIDWTNDKWNKALNYQDAKTGEYRQMDLWEWNKYLRTLPEWQKTDEAKNAYRNMAYSLAQGFGKMA